MNEPPMADLFKIDKHVPTVPAMQQRLDELRENGSLDINEPDADGWTLFLRAVQNQRIDLAELLYGYDPDPNLESPGKYAAIHIATLNNDIEMMTFLCDHCGVSINAQTKKKGITPLHVSIMKYKKDAFDWLLLNDADQNIGTGKGDPLIPRNYDEKDDDEELPPRRVNKRKLPLLYAAMWGRLDMMDALIERGPNLYCGCELRFLTSKSADVSEQLEKIISYAVKAKQRDAIGMMGALEQAVYWGSIQNINYMVNQKHIPWTRNDLKRIYELASERGLMDVVESAIAMLSGAKTSQELGRAQEDVVRIRACARNMVEFMVKEDQIDDTLSNLDAERVASPEPPTGNRSPAYRALKRMVENALLHHAPYSDENLLAVFWYSRDYVHEDHVALCQIIVDMVDTSLNRAEKDSEIFVWFETYLSQSVIWYETSFPGIEHIAIPQSQITNMDRTSSFVERKVIDPEDYDEPPVYATYLFPQIKSSAPQYPDLTREELSKMESIIDELSDEIENLDVIRQDNFQDGFQASMDPIIMKMFDILGKAEVPEPSEVNISQRGRERATSLTHKHDRKSSKIGFGRFLTNARMSKYLLKMAHDYDKDVYLSRLAAFCEAVYGDYKDELKNLEREALQHIDGCAMSVAPIKTLDRAKEKVGTDYHDEKLFPKSARILDMLRCSITFDNVDSLCEGYRAVVEYIARKKRGDLRIEYHADDTTTSPIPLAGPSPLARVVSGQALNIDTGSATYGFISLLRVKNGFTQANSGKYQDIKFNVAFRDDDFGMTIVTEIQLILKDFYKVKDEGHRLYAITRTKELRDMVLEATKGGYLDKLCYQSAKTGNLGAVCKAVMMGANVTKDCQPNPDYDPFDRECKQKRELPASTPVMVASYYGHEKILRYILDLEQVKINPEVLTREDRNGKNPITIAVQYNRQEILDLLLQHRAYTEGQDLKLYSETKGKQNQKLVEIFKRHGIEDKIGDGSQEP